MLKNNRIAFIFALIMAVALWAYVLGTVDPVRTVTLKNIPIRLVDQSALSSQNLVITSMDHETINVTFTAKRSIANKIKAEDFHATADLGDIKLGDNIIMVNITKPSTVSVESVSPEYLNITTEQYITVEKDIEATIINPTKEDTEPTIIKISDEKVSISGPSIKIKKYKTLIKYQ